MPRLSLTDEQFGTARQTVQSRYIKIELLNHRYQTVDSLEGRCTGGNLSIDASSDIRRTGNIILTVSDSTFEVEPGGKIFLDKYLRVLVGIYSLRTGEISWTNCGLYIIDAPNYHYEASTNTLTISLLDLMAKMTGIRNGYLKGLKTVFKAGEPLRESIIAMIQFAGFTKYIVESPPAPGVIPFDIEFGQGSTVYDVLKGLLDFYPEYEMFFDVNGTFVYQKRPTGLEDPVIIDDSLWDSISTVEDIAVDFQNVKNSIEVYGRSHNPSRFSTETSVTKNNIHLKIADVYHYFNNIIYGFTLTDNPGYNNMTIEINDLGPVRLATSDGTTSAIITAEPGEIYYCVQYREILDEHGNVIDKYFYWLGHLQSYGFAEDTNPKSPYYIDGPVGRIRLPLFGDVYDNIFTDELAQQRAQYELYLHANLNDTITLTCVPVYWLDVNILVEYTMRRNKKKEKYLIKSINIGLGAGDSMTLVLMRFYPTE